MEQERALDLIRTQLDGIDPLEYSKVNPAFDKWQRDTRVVLEQVFGVDSSQVQEFTKVPFCSNAVSVDKSRRLTMPTDSFNMGKSKARSMLESIIGEIEQFWEDSEIAQQTTHPLDYVRKLCDRFHLVARQIRSRHDGRTTLEIEDEYDVQDLLHALLKIEFDDVRPEEWTPSYAGKSARMDFLIKQHSIVIETKKTRSGLTEKKVGDELIVDIARYNQHPDCKTLVCFAYDPEGRIGNPLGLENDLSGDHNGLAVIIIVRPK